MNNVEYSLDRQEAYFKKVKILNVNFYKLLKKCQKENKIYNGELKRLKSFYYGFAKGSFAYDTDVYGSYYSNTIPLLKKYETKTWESIANKNYKKLKTWDKSTIKSGKRPKEDTVEYKEKLYKQAQEEDKALCGICHKYWEQVDMSGTGQKFGLSKNVLADHGFTLAYGGRNGVCFGARFHSWEKSPKVKIEYVKQVLNVILKGLSKQKPTVVDLDDAIQQANNYNNAVVEFSNISQDIKQKYNDLHWSFRRKSNSAYGASRPFFEDKKVIGSFIDYLNVKGTPELLDVYKVKSEIVKPSIIFEGMRIAMTLPTNKDDITLELLTRIWSDHKDQVEAEKLKFETAIKNWKLQLTPREKMNKGKA